MSKKANNRIKKVMSVDFKPAGMMPEVKEAYYFMNMHNTKGRSYDTSSTYLVDAYKVYKTPHSDVLNDLNKDSVVMKYLVDKYGFTSREQMMSYLDGSSVEKLSPIPDASRKCLTFYEDDADAMELFNILNSISGKERILVISAIINNYLNLGYDSNYLDYEADIIMKSLINMYKTTPDARHDITINHTIDLILFNGTGKVMEKPAATSTDLSYLDSVVKDFLEKKAIS